MVEPGLGVFEIDHRDETMWVRKGLPCAPIPVLYRACNPVDYLIQDRIFAKP